MKILLISPQCEYDYSYKLIPEIPYVQGILKKNLTAPNAPLALVTVAALTPPDHEITLHDEHMHGHVEPVLEKHTYDIVGISFLTSQLNRTFAIAEFCKKNNGSSILALGGPGTAFLPKGFNRYVDVVFLGEAEETWQQFLKDYTQGTYKPLYQQISKPDMAKSPVPRWDIIREDLPYYGTAAVQTTRGCPFDCLFCSVIYLYGRKPRSKPIAQVLEEIRVLEGMGIKTIFITDDNFGTDKRYAKELLREIIKLNNSFEFPLTFMTTVDITISRDEELLQLMADANVVGVLIGIESVNRESLRDLNKKQNLSVNLLEAVHKIQSYGIMISASMLFGADSDDPTIFEQTAQFIKEGNIIACIFPPLFAPSGTKLWYQLKHQGRLVEESTELKNWIGIMVMSNIVPKKMTRIELMEKLADLLEELYDPLNYMERVICFVRGVTYKRSIKRPPLRLLLSYAKTMFLMFRYFLFQVTPDHRKAFFTILRTTRKVAPYLMPQMILLHTAFIIGQKREFHTAKLLREQASWEKAHPEAIKIEDQSLPIPMKIREKVNGIVTTAYLRVRKKISDKELLYQVVTEAMADYTERHGAAFHHFDEQQRQWVIESCDRAMSRCMTHKEGHVCDLSEKELPYGFEREILDALDRSLRYRACLST